MRTALLAASVGILSACVASTTPPGELLSGLTPTENTVQSNEQNLVETVSEAAEIEKTTEADTTTGSALAAQSDATPAETALEASTKPVPRPQSAPEKETTKIASAEQEATPPASTAPAVVKPEPKKKPSLLASIFQSNQAGKNTANGTQVERSKTTGRVIMRPKAKVSSRSASSSANALPGVRTKGLFGIFSNDRPSEDLDEPVEVASVTNLARRGNFGLLLQRPDVKVSCFPRSLVSLLKKVERRFGRTPIVTSGYRSPAKNRRIRGARNSSHITCKAADIKVKGISKWQLAKYLRSLPGRGGVGTYCHTNSVHIDVGKKRDWNWRCRRKKRRNT